MGTTVARFARFLSLQKRLERARNYARQETSSLSSFAQVSVQGTEPEPKFPLSLNPFPDERWVM